MFLSFPFSIGGGLCVLVSAGAMPRLTRRTPDGVPLVSLMSATGSKMFVFIVFGDFVAVFASVSEIVVLLILLGNVCEGFLL